MTARTLADLTMYEGKHNEANGEENRDGISDNLSRNWGAEGPSDDPNDPRYARAHAPLAADDIVLVARRADAARAAMNSAEHNKATTTPIARTTRFPGSTGARPITALIAWTARLIALRRDLSDLREDRFRHGKEIVPGFRDLDWLDERNEILSEEDWQNAEGRALVMRRTSRRADGKVEIIALLMNSSEDALDFALPEDLRWRVILTARSREREARCACQTGL